MNNIELLSEILIGKEAKMEKQLDMHTRKSLLKSFYDKYKKAGRKEKGLLLDDYIRHTGHNRKYVISQLNSKDLLKKKLKQSRHKKPKYNKEIVTHLKKIWAIFDESCGQRLTQQIKNELDRLIGFGELTVTEEERTKLLEISSTTIDRKLKKHKKEKIRSAHGTTRPGTFLKSQIPVRLTWNTNNVGYQEMDLVAHNGGNPYGQFVNTLSVTDIAIQWWEGEAIMGKSAYVVNEGIKEIRKRLPFSITGVDSDTGAEFINHLLFNYCKEEGIEFTRGRAYHKNDNAHVEQKNWTHVRKMLGNHRFDTTAEQLILNHLYRNELRLYKNFFQVTYKLESKEWIHGKRKRQYEKQLKTPYQRLLESDQISDVEKKQLKDLYLSLNPADLKRRIDKTLDTLKHVHSKKIDIAKKLKSLQQNPSEKEVA